MEQIKQIKVKNSAGEEIVVNAALTNLYRNTKDNLCLETSAELGGKNVNIESGKDIKFKPVDDIAFYADHRASTDEISVKILRENEAGADEPVKLQINTADITLTTKDKPGTKADNLDIVVNQKKNTKGNLKVKAKAIDLRAHDGGIALQPSKHDANGHENKIKFESDRTNPITEAVGTYAGEGGEGLEFATFNNLHTSIYTKDYRFNKDGKIYAVTRQTPSVDPDSTGSSKFDYPTQSDDFKDVIDEEMSCTWKDIITAVKLMKAANSDAFAA